MALININIKICDTDHHVKMPDCLASTETLKDYAILNILKSSSNPISNIPNKLVDHIG